jgi:diguanylate cyclase (GGDEF)-like protein
LPPEHDELAALKRLHGFLEVTRLVRSEEQLPELLAAIASSIGESLGFGVVVIHLYRPAWDDFEATTVHGGPAVRDLLLGDARDWTVWGPLLDERFLRAGAYFVPHGRFDWSSHAPGSYVPQLGPRPEPDAWHPEDALFVPLRHTDGHLVGILSVDEPLHGLIPSQDELDTLTALADHAALAIQSAQESARASRHRRALEELLAVSSRLSETFAIETIMQAVCDGIHTALGFTNVCIDLPDADTGILHARAATGWKVDDEAINTVMTPRELQPLFDPRFEVEGCYLLTPEQAESRISDHHNTYCSVLNGRGPHAWQNHWLVVPLWSRSGELMGAIWADDPVDRLVPSTERLQALRVFANQATTALDAAAQFEEMHFLADHDPLTRLSNRRSFNARLEAEVRRSVRYDHPLSLVLCDLDGFKALNDSLGHASGDAALERVGAVLQAAVRANDDVFRIGGDEFAVLLPEAGAEESRAVIARVAGALRHDPGIRGLGASFGIAVCPADATDPQLLFRRADAAMYAAKPDPNDPHLRRAG